MIKLSKLNSRHFFKASLIALASVSVLSTSARADTLFVQKTNKWDDQRRMALTLMAGIASGRLAQQDIEMLCTSLNPTLTYIAFKWLRSIAHTQEQNKFLRTTIDTPHLKIFCQSFVKSCVEVEFDKDDSLIKQGPHQIVDWAIQQLQLVEA